MKQQRAGQPRWPAVGVMVVLAGLMLVALAGCARDGQPAAGQPASIAGAKSAETGAAPDDAGREAWPAELRFGIIPVEGGADVLERFRPLVEHLSAELGVPVVPQAASSYNGVVVAMANRQVEIAYFGPKSYVEAARRAGAEAVAMEVSDTGEPGYYSIIIARADSGMRTLEDARGKSFAFTGPNSTSGCLVPRVLLERDLGVRPKELFADPIRFTGSHGNSIIQVKNSHLDVAAINTIDLARAVESGVVQPDDFVVLWKSDMIPGSPMTVRRDLPQSLKDAFLAALQRFSENEAGLKKMAIQGYVPTTDAAYDVVRYLMRKERDMNSGEGDG